MIEIVKNELISVQKWTQKLLDDINEAQWKQSPEGFKTNINWQIGHLIISTYFHTIVCINGSDPIIKEAMDPRYYSSNYGMGSNALVNLTDKPDSIKLIRDLSLIDSRGLEIIDAMSVDELDEKPILENPMAKTKKDALLWAAKHRMWHNGQIALIKSHLNHG